MSPFKYKPAIYHNRLDPGTTTQEPPTFQIADDELNILYYVVKRGLQRRHDAGHCATCLSVCV